MSDTRSPYRESGVSGLAYTKRTAKHRGHKDALPTDKDRRRLQKKGRMVCKYCVGGVARNGRHIRVCQDCRGTGITTACRARF